MSINSDMDKAIIELATANQRLVSADVRLSDARRDQCTAINVVNEAQKRIDALVAGLRNSASRDTDWAKQTRKGNPFVLPLPAASNEKEPT